MIEAKKLALRIAEAAKNKKALRPVILDLTKVSGLCDFFVILSGTSLRHANAIAQGIAEELGQLKIKSLSRVFPDDESGWVVLDYVSVVAHVFYQPIREFYSLERLWGDAKRVRIPRKPAL